MADHKYVMTMDLNVLHHLGIKLYSNVSAVLSEVVANSWDADAEKVGINIGKDKIVITDNGCGMTVEDANKKYLRVGYERREEESPITQKHKRPVMGRKGIGKLSLFSIANTIEIQSIKDGEKHGLRMSAEGIEETIKAGTNRYYPETIPTDEITFDGEQGTCIVLMDLKKRASTAVDALKKRLARRFSIIGNEYDFSVVVNEQQVSIEDRDYFHKLQYLWYYGDESQKYVEYCNRDKLKKSFKRKCQIKVEEEFDGKIKEMTYEIGGWVGTVGKSGDLKDEDDNLNKIIVMVRGKLAQEDILEDFSEGGLYTKYLIGELHADFLDLDNKEDIATSNRQEIRKDDPRYTVLKEWVKAELKNIEASWTDLRNKGGTEKALENPAIKEWFGSLAPKSQKRAEILFGKINQLTINSEEERKELFKYSVMAFESLRYKENLEALDSLTPDNIRGLKEIFSDLDDIEATLYHQIVTERLLVIEKLQLHVEDNALEKVVQQHLYEHLWLLDPSWDRATETPLMEKQVGAEFKKIDAKLTPEEKKSRYDIKYKNPAGKHVIIELKKAGRSINSFDLAKQVDKYIRALTKILKQVNREHEPVEVVCLLGKPCSNWTDKGEEKKARDLFDRMGVRIVMYQQLIENAYKNYEAFLNKKQELGRISKLIRSI